MYMIWRTVLEKCCIISLALQWIFCSEWVPSESQNSRWKHRRFSQVIHKTTIRQCIDAKSCMFVINKSIVKAILLPLFLSAVWTLILMAPIHFRGSIGNQVMYYYISPNIFLWRNNIDCTAVKILDFSYHCYCGHKNSQYRYIAISIETLGRGGMSNIFFTSFIELLFFTHRT